MHQLLRNVKVIGCLTEIAAGSTVYQGSIIDTRGFRGVAFLGLLGTITTAATFDLHAEAANTSATTDMVDIEDSKCAGDTADAIQGAILTLDLGRPTRRWYRPVIMRADANAVIRGVVGLLYNPVQAAVSHDTATVDNSVYLSEETTGNSSGS